MVRQKRHYLQGPHTKQNKKLKKLKNKISLKRESIFFLNHHFPPLKKIISVIKIGIFVDPHYAPPLKSKQIGFIRNWKPIFRSKFGLVEQKLNL